jgi:hypothetical protein
LSGPYCSQCGQHVHDSARSLGVLLHDGWHVVTHVDGRFWSTIAALVLRPGKLTLEYFADRRARYLPPVRLYLVLSVLFFALASFGSRIDADYDGDGKAASKAPAGAAAAVGARVAGAVDAAAHGAAGTPAPAAADDDDADLHPATGGPPPASAGGGKAHWTGRLKPDDCSHLRSDLPGLEEPLRAACRRNVGDHGRATLHAFVSDVPKMMFVFLPVMAGVMLLLYWRPRRFYVEHLVFFLHTHAALFLVLTVTLLFGRLAGVVPLLKVPSELLDIAAFLYAVCYVYQAMRRYYGQNRWWTITKLWVVGTAYVLFLTITLLVTLVVSAITA